jgi:periplasmic mercuric ion binding protein
MIFQIILIFKLTIMKTIKIFSLAILFMTAANLSFAQAVKKEAIKVAGNCGMCKSKIEKAAKAAGASYALWNKDSKVLTVKYSSTSTNSAKIQEKIAGVGYDTPKYKATSAAYDGLDDCCKYERVSSDKVKSCCDDAKCTKEKCEAGSDKCKNADGTVTDCCKSGKCEMKNHKDHSSTGKCNKEDCCKKS